MRSQMLFALLAITTLSTMAGQTLISSPVISVRQAPQNTTADEGRRTSDETNTIDVFKRASTGVLHVKASRFGPAGEGEPAISHQTGSGFLIDKSGHVLTNYHVIDGMSQVQLITHGGETLKATMVGTAPAFDVALLKAEFTQSATNPLLAIPLGESDKIEIGQKVLAIGNPLGLHNALTTGIVSGLSRNLPGAPVGLGHALIQTDAAINPGNSGGPLLDSSGRVIGINTAVVRDGQNIGFAVPIDLIKRILPDLMDMGHAYAPALGFTALGITPDLAALFGIPVAAGLLVQDVVYGSPASVAGLRGGDRMIPMSGEVYVLGGDIIVAANGQDLERLQDLTTLLLVMAPGDRVTLTILRAGQRQEKQITLPPMHHRNR